MISFLTSAKPFTGPYRDLQIRAIKSWLSTAPNVEVTLYGHSEGAAEVCRKLGIGYVPDVQTSPHGIPLFNSIAKHAKDNATHDMQVYVNCDILLTSSLVKAVRAISFEHFLLVGQRVDLSDSVSVDVHQPYWLQELHDVADNGMASLHPPSGKDYFVFPRGLWDSLPPLVIGRAGYDDALLAFCLRSDIPIIDGTFDVVALHQFHDNNRRNAVWKGPDVRFNERMHPGITHSAPAVSDAQWTLRRARLEQTLMRGDRIRQLELYLRFVKEWEIPGYTLRAIWRLLKSTQIIRPQVVDISEVLDSYAEALD